MPSNNRSQLEQTTDNWLIVDAYNANPTSMAAAIDNFSRTHVPQPKMAILGDMRELGEVSGQEHQKIADLLAMTPHGWRASAERRANVIDQAEPFEVTVSMRYDYFVLN